MIDRFLFSKQNGNTALMLFVQRSVCLFIKDEKEKQLEFLRYLVEEKHADITLKNEVSKE